MTRGVAASARTLSPGAALDLGFGRKARRGRRPQIPWALAPAAIFYVLFFGWPLCRMAWQSIWADGGFTLAGYAEFFTEPLYWWVLGYTVALGLATLVLTLAIGYPVAFWLVRLDRTMTTVLMAFVLVPLWSSGLVRTYAWIVIVGRDGILNTILLRLGVISTPLPFLGTHAAVLVGLTYYLLPYMILSLYSVMKGIDRRLMLAAQNLGATPLRAFREVFVPLTAPGIFAGSFLVFMLAIGMYITPALLGGPDQTTLPLIIANQVNEALDWNLAAALSMILLVLTSVLQALAHRRVDVERTWGGVR